MSDEIAQLSIKNLLSGGVDYVIPMYQRNYAWDEGEITQLMARWWFSSGQSHRKAIAPSTKPSTDNSG